MSRRPIVENGRTEGSPAKSKEGDKLRLSAGKEKSAPNSGQVPVRKGEASGTWNILEKFERFLDRGEPESRAGMSIRNSDNT